jgi:hypothetical protein
VSSSTPHVQQLAQNAQVPNGFVGRAIDPVLRRLRDEPLVLGLEQEPGRGHLNPALFREREVQRRPEAENDDRPVLDVGGPARDVHGSSKVCVAPPLVERFAQYLDLRLRELTDLGPVETRPANELHSPLLHRQPERVAEIRAGVGFGRLEDLRL